MGEGSGPLDPPPGSPTGELTIRFHDSESALVLIAL